MTDEEEEDDGGDVGETVPTAATDAPDGAGGGGGSGGATPRRVGRDDRDDDDDDGVDMLRTKSSLSSSNRGNDSVCTNTLLKRAVLRQHLKKNRLLQTLIKTSRGNLNWNDAIDRCRSIKTKTNRLMMGKILFKQVAVYIKQEVLKRCGGATPVGRFTATFFLPEAIRIKPSDEETESVIMFEVQSSSRPARRGTGSPTSFVQLVLVSILKDLLNGCVDGLTSALTQPDDFEYDELNETETSLILDDLANPKRREQQSEDVDRADAVEPQQGTQLDSFNNTLQYMSNEYRDHWMTDSKQNDQDDDDESQDGDESQDNDVDDDVDMDMNVPIEPTANVDNGAIVVVNEVGESQAPPSPSPPPSPPPPSLKPSLIPIKPQNQTTFWDRVIQQKKSVATDLTNVVV